MATEIVRVSEVMTAHLVYLHADTSAREAAETLTRHRIHGAPVLGEDKSVVGVVSKTDLLDARNYPRDREAVVGDLMTHIVLAVRTTDPLMLAVRLMVNEDVHRALVMNEDGTLAGVVAPMDVLRALAKGLPIGDPSHVESMEYVNLAWVGKNE